MQNDIQVKSGRRVAMLSASKRSLDRVAASMVLLQTRAMPVDLPLKANLCASKMMKRTVRSAVASVKFEDSTVRRRNLWASRLSFSVTNCAATVMLCVLLSLLGRGFAATQVVASDLAVCHWNRHIDPDDEFLSSSEMTRHSA